MQRQIDIWETGQLHTVIVSGCSDLRSERMSLCLKAVLLGWLDLRF